MLFPQNGFVPAAWAQPNSSRLDLTERNSTDHSRAANSYCGFWNYSVGALGSTWVFCMLFLENLLLSLLGLLE